MRARGPGRRVRVGTAAIAWLAHYVKGDRSVDTGARFDFIDQTGAAHHAGGWPLDAGQPISGTGQGSVSLAAEGGSGPRRSLPAVGS